MLDPSTPSPNDPISDHHPLRQPNSTPMTRYGARARRTARNYEGYAARNVGDGVRLGPDRTADDDESGVCSPPLWSTGGAAAAAAPPRVVVAGGNSYRSLSPNSKSQAIARGQWELMEMVKDMPETCFELSLKDLVEHPHRPEGSSNQEQCLLRRDDNRKDFPLYRGAAGEMVARQGSGRRRATAAATGGSIDKRGVFLKTVFPVPLGFARRKSFGVRNNSGPLAPPNASAKVSSTPDAAAERPAKGPADGEWWKKRSGSTESESRGSSSGNTGRSSSSGSIESTGSSRNGDNVRRKSESSTCCLPFYHLRRSKSAE